jgi:hypothetical protein
MAPTTKLTSSDIELGLDNPAWSGHGYLGERGRQPHAAVVRGDAFLLREANARGWAIEELFDFTNSRVGRHFGDLVFGGWDDAEVEKQLPGLIRWAIREGAVTR